MGVLPAAAVNTMWIWRPDTQGVWGGWGGSGAGVGWGGGVGGGWWWVGGVGGGVGGGRIAALPEYKAPPDTGVVLTPRGYM